MTNPIDDTDNTGIQYSAVPRFGDCCSCCWLPHLPQLACSNPQPGNSLIEMLCSLYMRWQKTMHKFSRGRVRRKDEDDMGSNRLPYDVKWMGMSMAGRPSLLAREPRGCPASLPSPLFTSPFVPPFVVGRCKKCGESE